MPVATQFCVCLENKPGTFARLCAVLARGQVNVEAVFVSQGDADGFCWVNFVATPSTQVDQVLLEAAYHFVPEKVLALPLENRPGELERIADRMAEAGVNINYVYGGGYTGSKFLAVLSVDNLEQAVGALERR